VTEPHALTSIPCRRISISILTVEPEPGRRPLLLLMLAREVVDYYGHPHVRQIWSDLGRISVGGALANLNVRGGPGTS